MKEAERINLTNQIVRILGNFFKKALPRNGVLAGGAIANTILFLKGVTNKLVINDLDVFYDASEVPAKGAPTDIQIQWGSRTIMDVGSYGPDFEDHGGYTMHTIMESGKLNEIWVTPLDDDKFGPELIINGFDLNVCQAALRWEGSKWELYTTPEFEELLVTKVIDTTSPHSIFNTAVRAMKKSIELGLPLKEGMLRELETVLYLVGDEETAYAKTIRKYCKLPLRHRRELMKHFAKHKSAYNKSQWLITPKAVMGRNIQVKFGSVQLAFHWVKNRHTPEAKAKVAFSLYYFINSNETDMNTEHVEHYAKYSYVWDRVDTSDPLNSLTDMRDKWFRSLWEHYFGRVPESKEVSHSLEPEIVEGLSKGKNFKAFLNILNRVYKYERERRKVDDPRPQIGNHTVCSAATVAVAFGGNMNFIDSWLDSYTCLSYWGGHYSDDLKRNLNQEVHDAGQNLPNKTMPKPAMEFAHANRKKGDKQTLCKILNNWNIICKELHQPPKDWDIAVKVIGSMTYPRAKNKAFAAESARWGVNESNYYKWEKRWLDSLNNKGYSTIPNIKAELEGYKMYRLDDDDPRGVYLGEHTDCCQHPEGQGKTCAWHGIASPNGAFYVIEKQAKVVAMSWTWRSKEIVMFDNIEVKGHDESYNEIISRLYTEVAKNMMGIFGIREVRVGHGYTDINIPNDWLRVTDNMQLTKAPIGVYTDTGRQSIIWTSRTPEEIECCKVDNDDIITELPF